MRSFANASTRYALKPQNASVMVSPYCSLISFVMVALILTTQRRADQLAGHRGQMILELSILNDQKISKVIALLEEGRRDNPALRNRADGEADAMSTPADTRAVLEAIKDVQADPASPL